MAYIISSQEKLAAEKIRTPTHQDDKSSTIFFSRIVNKIDNDLNPQTMISNIELLDNHGLLLLIEYIFLVIFYFRLLIINWYEYS